MLYEDYIKFLGEGELEKLKKQTITDKHVEEAHKMNFIIKPAKLKHLGKMIEHDEVILTPNDFRAKLAKCN